MVRLKHITCFLLLTFSLSEACADPFPSASPDFARFMDDTQDAEEDFFLAPELMHWHGVEAYKAFMPVYAPDALFVKIAKPLPVRREAFFSTQDLPLSEGLVWRIYALAPRNDSLVMVAQVQDRPLDLDLLPGRYYGSLGYGYAYTFFRMDVGFDKGAQPVILTAGALDLRAVIGDTIQLRNDFLSFDVFEVKNTNPIERVEIARNVLPGRRYPLNAGIYHIISRYGDVNAVTRADVEVRAGQVTRALLSHKAAHVSFTMVNAPGGDALTQTDWTLLTKEGGVLLEASGPFLERVLSEGAYTVQVNRHGKSYWKNFDVRAGEHQKIEILAEQKGGHENYE